LKKACALICGIVNLFSSSWTFNQNVLTLITYFSFCFVWIDNKESENSEMKY
jgi:hypothetical protein